jgi:uncharacterized membrane protein YwaF
MLYFDFINPYITYMIVVLLFVGTIVAIFRKRDFFEKNKDRIIKITMILLIWTQLARYIGVFFVEDQEWSFYIFTFRIISFRWGTHLPFYICRLSVIVLLYYTITKDKRVESFLFYWGATGLAGIIYPNGPIENIHNLTETFYIDHFFLGLTPYFLVAYQGYRPSKKDLYVITAIMFVILSIFIPINNWLDTIPGVGDTVDYFYVNDQSIVGDLFPGLPSIVFVTIHTGAAFIFFSGYYYLFRRRVPIAEM